MADPFQLGATASDLDGPLLDVGEGLGPLLDVGTGLLGGLGSLMGLFGGGGEQSQNQNQNQNQSQSQNATSNSYSSANAKAYNNLTINYPNESGGMALQGLLGSQTPVGEVAAPNSLSTPTASIASLPTFQSPGFLATGMSSPASMLPEQAQAMGLPTQSGAIEQAPTPQAASSMGQFALPAMLGSGDQLAATPGGGTFNPVQAAQQMLSAPSNPGPAAIPYPVPSGGVSPSPMLQGSAWYSAPGSNQPALLASAGGGGNPFMPDATSDATGSVMPSQSQPDTLLPSQFTAPKMDELRAPQYALDNPEPKQLSRKKDLSLADQHKPAKGGDAAQIDAGLPDDIRKQFLAAQHAYDSAGEAVANSPATIDKDGQPVSHREYQKMLQGRIDDTEKHLMEARDHTAKLAGHLQDLLSTAYGGESDEPQSLAAQADRDIQDVRNRTAGYIQAGLAYWSPASNPRLNQRLHENRELSTKILNFLNPGRKQSIERYVAAQTAAINEAFEKGMPLAQKQIENQATVLNNNLQHQIMADRVLLANDRSELNADKRAELAQAAQMRQNAHQEMMKQLQIAQQDQDRAQRMRIAQMIDQRDRAFHADTVRYQQAMIGLGQEARDIGAMNAAVNADMAPSIEWRNLNSSENPAPTNLQSWAPQAQQQAQQILKGQPLQGIPRTAPPVVQQQAKQFNDTLNDTLNGLVQSGKMTRQQAKDQGYALFQAMKQKMGW